MPSLLLPRLFLVLFTGLVLGCSGKEKAPAPAAPLPASLTGTWELTKQIITTYDAGGAVLTSNTYDTYVANAQIWRYVFEANGRFDYTYQGDTARKGTYKHTSINLVQTNDPGFGNRPTFTFAIQQLTTAELVLVSDSRTTTGQESVTTWAKR